MPTSVFVSYARESAEHNSWVRRLADALERLPEFRLTFDQYELHAGRDIPQFMERGLACERIVVVVTPEYVRKATSRVGGVGFESSVIAAELASDALADRFVPVLRDGLKVPAYLMSKLYVDFREDRKFETALAELVSALRPSD